MQKIVTHLWFDTQAEEAVTFYTSLFNDSSIGAIARYGDSMAEVAGRPKNSVMTVEFKLNGQDFLALNGGPLFKFNESISLLVHCESQEEVDRLYGKLSQGGQAQPCGWLKDKYGLSWQIVPTVLTELVKSKDPQAVERVMKAMLGMKKLDIRELQQAARG